MVGSQLVRGFIFDFDGTLVSLKIDPPKMKAAMIAELTSQGFNTNLLDTSLPTQVIIDYARGQVEAGSVATDFGQVRSRLYAVLDALELEWNATSSPIDGATEVLERLRRSHIGLAVVTNSGRASAQPLLDKYALSGLFDCIVTRDDVNTMKPDPEGILKAMGAMGLTKVDTVFVGDSAIDIRAARAAGIRMAAVTTGYHSADRLRTEGADYIIGSLGELDRIVLLDQKNTLK
jgi:phosphoglycolate phosphatase